MNSVWAVIVILPRNKLCTESGLSLAGSDSCLVHALGRLGFLRIRQFHGWRPMAAIIFGDLLPRRFHV
jgi:hypothetical protein